MWNYNGANELTSEVQPESGATSYTYDDDGLVASKTDARNQTTHFHYDANHRLIEITAPVAADTLTFTYDEADNRKTLTGGGAATVFEDHEGNRLTTREDQIGGHALVTTYGYDSRDNLTSITYPSGRVVQNHYDYANRITKVYAGSAIYAQNLTYHPTGALASAAYGNGTSESLTLTDRFRPWQLTSGPLDLTYHYEANGNVDEITDARSGYSSYFTYDALDRLRIVGWDGATEFTYDAQGNRVTKGTGSSQVTYSYSPTTNRLTMASSTLGVPETGTFTYDDAGNMSTDGSGTYTYGFRNQMASATINSATTSYADRRRRPAGRQDHPNRHSLLRARPRLGAPRGIRGDGGRAGRGAG